MLPGFMPGSLANYQVWRGIQITNANITLQIRSDNDVNVVSVAVHNNNTSARQNRRTETVLPVLLGVNSCRESKRKGKKKKCREI